MLARCYAAATLAATAAPSFSDATLTPFATLDDYFLLEIFRRLILASPRHLRCFFALRHTNSFTILRRAIERQWPPPLFFRLAPARHRLDAMLRALRRRYAAPRAAIWRVYIQYHQLSQYCFICHVCLFFAHNVMPP